MTPRQARTERRAAERKAKKADMRRNKQIGLELDDRPLEEEFSAELMAEANAMRDRVHRRIADLELAAAPPPPSSVPQNPSRAETNRQNAQHSTGPRTSTGKLASSRNSLKHGLTSCQIIIPGEDRTAFEALLQSLLEEHQPATPTEDLLIQEMAQSYWLAQRAVRLQNECFTAEGVDEKRLALFLRYQTTHTRAFHNCLADLLKLRAETRKQQIGFDSHRSRQAEELRREADEKRKQEKHKMQVCLLQAEGEHRQMKNSTLDPSATGAQARVDRILAHENAA